MRKKIVRLVFHSSCKLNLNIGFRMLTTGIVVLGLIFGLGANRNSSAEEDEYDKIILDALNDIEKVSEELRNEIINAEKPSEGSEGKPAENQTFLPAPQNTPEIISEFPGDLITQGNMIELLEVERIPVRDLLTAMAARTAKGIEIIGEVNQDVTLSLKNVDVKDAVVIIVESANLAFKEENGSMKVMTKETFELREGHSFVSVQQTKTIKLAYVDAAKVIGSLEKIKNPSGKVFFNESSKTLTLLDSPKMIEAMMEYVQRVDVKVESRTFVIAHRKVDMLGEELSALLTKDVGVINVDTSANSVIVTDAAEKMTEIQKFINAWDQADSAVELRIRILQVMLNDENRMGIDWEAIVVDFQKKPFPGFMYESPSSSENYLNLGTLTEEDYQVLLDALDTVGVVNTVSPLQTQRLSPGNSHTIALRADQLSAMGGEDIASESDPEIDFAVRANFVTKEKGKRFVQLDIEPKLYSGTGTLVVPTDSESPKVTRVEFPLDQTLVVGGLFKDVMVESTRKIPFLGDLPIFGFAFRNQGESLQRTEVIIFITPADAGEASKS